MTEDRPGIVLVHGAWHDGRTWARVAPLLRARGFAVRTPDLPGAGRNARWPACFRQSPPDRAAMATEPTPNPVTQAERTAAAVAECRAGAAEGNGRVILLGHSLGGLTIGPAAEAVPELLHAVVYLSARLPPPGLDNFDLARWPEMQAAMVPGLLVSDPAVTGARRIDVTGGDAGYRARLRECFWGDLDEAVFAAALACLHPDEPDAISRERSPLTPARFGRVRRHYIRCTEDRAIPVSGQDRMIVEIDAAMSGAMTGAKGGRTEVVTMVASHSPFLSRPRDLADLIERIAG